MKMSPSYARRGFRTAAAATTAIRAAELCVHVSWSSAAAIDGSNLPRHRAGQQHRPGCAVLYSGHVRSFVQPRVHLSHKENLIEQLKIDCDVDVFMYLSVEDAVPARSGRGDLVDELSFTAYSPEQSTVDRVVQLFSPVAIEFHQEQAGYIPNRCEHGCEFNAYWQLYKMKAVFHMMEEHEALRKMPYMWVVRSRLDIAWILPMPPISQFPPIRVTAGHNFFPLADQLLLVPRQFAPVVFGAVKLCYVCSILKTQAESGIPAQTETLLRLAMRQAGVPFGFYEFPVVIVRNTEGGVCGVLHPHKLTCQLLHSRALIDPAAKCANVVNRWYRGACRKMFPPLLEDNISPPSKAHEARKVVNIGNIDGAVSSTHGYQREDNGGLENDTEAVNGMCSAAGPPQGSRLKSDRDYFHRLTPENAFAGGSGIHHATPLSLSFEQATTQLEEIHGDISGLREAIRVRAAPERDILTMFGAHHYPFHQINAERRDAISIIAGFRLSQVDLNRVALAFACFLSDIETGSAFKASSRTTGKREQTGAANVRGDDERLNRDQLLVMRTSDGSSDLRAVVNCTLVKPLHDVWVDVLLNNEFEPSEPVCRGPVGPCFDRASTESQTIFS